jgi:hypothetical protein
MKRILLFALICVLASFQPGWAGRSDYGPATDCFEIVTGILTLPCRIVATCLGLDAQPVGTYRQCYDPCHGAPPWPRKKVTKKSAEDYSTKVISPMAEPPGKPTARQGGAPAQPPIPEKASWPPPSAENPSQGGGTGVATPGGTARPSVAASQGPSQPTTSAGKRSSQPSGPDAATPAPQAAAPKAPTTQPQRTTDKKKDADKTAQVKERLSSGSQPKAGTGKQSSPEAKISEKKEKKSGGAVYQPCAPMMMQMPCYPQFYYR